MPTENRSSNTENAPCPFCGGQVDPEGWLRGDGTRGPECESCGATAPNLALWNSAQPAQQHQGEPVAWMDPRSPGMHATISNEVKQHNTGFGGAPASAVSDYSIPLYTHPAPAGRQGPMAWLNTANGAVTASPVQVMDWDDESEPVQALYTHADTAEAGQLREVIKHSDAQIMRQSMRISNQRAQLAKRDELLREIADHCNGCVMPTEDLLRDWGSSIDALLSASSEPDAPCKQGSPLEAVRATVIQDLLDRAATAIGQYGDSLLGRGQREDSVDLLDLEREVRDLEQEFGGAFALTSTQEHICTQPHCNPSTLYSLMLLGGQQGRSHV